jgi:hypothetical integral membrane protein (TIGR02206 family)
MTTFRPFSLTHALVLLALAALTTALIVRRRRLRDSLAATRFDRRLGVIATFLWLFIQLVQFLPRYYDRASSLPLHVCDFSIIAVPLALLTGWRPARAIAYFWGIGLSTQGLITPDLRFGPATLPFWLFWATHFVIVGGGIYEVAARGFRPAWKDYGVAAAAALAYAAVILPFDIATGLNYGYIGRAAPDQPSLVDALGPWPRRVPIMMGLAGIVMLLLLLPWEVGRLIARRPPARRAAAGAEPLLPRDRAN